MAPGQKLYPRATVKKIVKAHSGCNVSKNVDVMVRLPTRLPHSPLTNFNRFFSTTCSSCKRKETKTNRVSVIKSNMSRLMKEATIEAKQGGERGVTARSVRKVTGVGINVFFVFSAHL
jgi:hypothetical protein